MDELGIGQSELARQAGCAQANIGQLLSETIKTSKYLPAIARALGVTVEWLTYGEGAESVTPHVAEEQAPFLFDRTKSAWPPPGVTKGPATNHKNQKPAPNQLQLDLGVIAEIDVRAGAGMGGEAALEAFSPNGRDVIANDTVIGHWQMPGDYLATELRTKPGHVRMIAVEGDSMAPTLMSGDRVLVDTRRTQPSPPGVFAVWDGMSIVVKRLELIHGSDPPTVRIISDNGLHAAYERTADEANIIGRVIWFGRRL